METQAHNTSTPSIHSAQLMSDDVSRVSLNSGGILKIQAAVKDVAKYVQNGPDLVIKFKDGTQIIVEDFFNCTAGTCNQIDLVDVATGEVFRATPDVNTVSSADNAKPHAVTFSYEPLNTESEDSSDSLWVPALMAGGGGAAAAASGGVFGGDDDKPTPRVVLPKVYTPVLDRAIDSVAPVTGNFAHGGSTNDTRPVFEGHGAQPNAQVNIYSGTTLIGTVTVDGNGNWSFQPDSALADGQYSYKFKSVDGTGKEGPESATFSFEVDTVAPTAAPTLGSVVDNVPAITGPINDGDETNDPRPVISGSGAEPGTKVNVYDGTTLLGSTTVDGSGNWSFRPSSPLTEGNHSITVRNEDKAGNEGPASSPFTFEVDTQAPTAAPSLDSVVDNVAPVTGPITAGSTTNDPRPVISGSGAEPNSKVHIYDGSALIGTATANASGDWTFTPTTDLGEGAHSLTMRNEDTAGNLGPATDPFAFSVDTLSVGAAPTLDRVIDNVSPILGDLSHNGFTNDPRPVFEGHGAEPNGNVNVYRGGSLVDTVVADASGNWSFQPATALAEGNHSFTFRNSYGATGESAATAPFAFEVDTFAPTTAPTLGSVVDNVPAITGPITNGGITNDPQPVISGGGAEPNTKVNIYDGATLLGTVTADGSGNWTFTPPAPLGQGNHSLTVQNEDNAGNVSPSSAPFTFEVDTQAPTTAPSLDSVVDNIIPEIGPISAGGTTNDPQPVMSGSGAEPNSKVHIYDGVTLIGTVTATASGNWTFTPTTALSDGAHSITVRNEDTAGNLGPATSPFTFNVLTAAPGTAPVLDSVTDNVAPVTGTFTSGNATNDPRPVFVGHDADPNGNVAIYNGVTHVATVTADASGNWTYQPATPLANGNYNYTFHKVDGASNLGPASLPFAFEVDTFAPTMAPTLGSVVDNVPAILGPITNGGITNDPQPVISGGGAEPNTKVNIYDGATLLGTATTDGSGNWTFTPPAPLGQGNHNLTVQNEDRAGNVGPSSAPFTFEVDTQAPTTAPTLNTVLDDVLPVTGSITSGSSTNDARPEFQGGGAEPNSKVHIYDGAALIGTVTANAAGNWTFTPATPLSDGAHSVTFRNEDSAGNTGPASSPFLFEVDTQSPSTIPVLDRVIDNVTPVTGNLTDGDTTNDPRPVFEGSGGVANEKVNVYRNGVFVTSVDVDASGNWTFRPATNLPEGSHSFGFRNADAAGNEGPLTSLFQFGVDTIVPTTTPTLTSVTDNVDPVTGTIADGSTTNDPRPVFVGTNGEAGSWVLIYDGVNLIGRTLALAGGNWTFTPSADLDEGAHSFTFRTEDLSGNLGPMSAPFAFSVDTIVPTTTPSLTSLTDNVSPVLGVLDDGDTTNDPRPVFVGTGADANGKVHIYDGTTLLGRATADASGNWTFTPLSNLDEGLHAFRFRNADDAGNEGPSTVPFTITVDTLAPTSTPAVGSVYDDVAPVIGNIANGSTTNDPRPTFSGTGADSNSHVNVYNNGTFVASVTTDGSGEWSFEPSANLSDGNHSFTFRSVDAAGNLGPPSVAFNFTLDTSSPSTTPVLETVLDKVAPVTGVIAQGDTTNDPRPTFSGSGAEPNSRVNVYNGTDFVTFVTANSDGEWVFEPASALAEGAHSFTFRNTNAAGNEGPATAPFNFNVDTVVPTTAPTLDDVIDDVAPDTGTILAGSTTNDPTPTFVGSGSEPNIKVNVYDNGVLVGTVDTNASGAWTYEPDMDLTEGAHSFTFRNVDLAGNIGPATSVFEFTVQTVAPGTTPTLDSVTDDVDPVTGLIGNGGFSNDPRPDFAGSDGEPNEFVAVYDNGVKVATVLVDASGNWTYTPAADLSNGLHVFRFRKQNLASVEGPDSAAFNINIDTIAPTTTPTLDSVFDKIAPVIGELEAGETTNDPRPDFTGSGAEPNAKVRIYDNGIYVESVTANATGGWSYTPSADLTQGSHSFTFANADRAGNIGPVTSPFAFFVDTIAPTTTPVLTSATDNEDPITGVFYSGDTTNDPRPVLVGTGAEADGLVNIYDGTTLIAVVTADAAGEWTFTPTTDLLEGSHSFTFKNADLAGHEGPASPTFNFFVDTIAPTTTPVVDQVIDNALPVLGNIPNNGTTNDSRPEFRGSGAEPNTYINIYDGTTLIGTTTTNNTGSWVFTPGNDLDEGAHSFTFRNQDHAGLEGPASAPFNFTVDTLAPTTAPTLGSVVDNVAPVTGAITSGDATNDPRPVFNGGGATPGENVNIYDGDDLVGTVTADGSGNWTFRPDTPLTEGDHSFTFRNADAAGNEGPSTTPFTFKVDTLPPTSAPTLGGVTDNVPPVVGPVNPGESTNDPRPTFNGGGAEPGTKVNVYDGDDLIGSVEVDQDGNWSYTPGSDLGEGDHSITFKNEDDAGNEGPASPPFEFEVDTLAPTSAPTLGSVTDNVEPGIGAIDPGETTNDPRPVFSGSGAEPGTKVNVYDGPNKVGTVTVGSDGSWSYQPDSDLSEGEHSFTFKNEDNAGNEGPASSPFEFGVDTTVPTNAASIVSIAPDTGSSATDFITSATSITVHGHLGAPLAAGSTLQISTDNGGSWTNVTPTGTSWSYADSRTLTDGNYVYQTRIINAANISGPVTSKTVTIDTVGPATIVTTHIVDDTGISATDFITADTSITVHGTLGATLEVGEVAQISLNNGLTWQNVSVSGTTWFYEDTRTLATGSYVYKVRTIDTAGNTTNGNDTTVIIYTDIPGSISITSIDNDTGESANDFLTSATSITLHGKLAAALGANETAQISINGGTTWVNITNVTGMDWSFADSRTLTDGSYQYMVRIIDTAGNAGPTSSQNVTIDTIPPTPVTITRIIDGIDPGRADIVDGSFTNDASPRMIGTSAEPYSIVRVYNVEVDPAAFIGETRADAAGNWTFVPSAPLDDGAHSWVVRNLDAAGNLGAPTTAIRFTVDTQLPTDSFISALTGDSGASNTDFITNNGTVTLSGTFSFALEADETALISVDGGDTWATITDITGTNWSYTDPVTRADGVSYYKVYVKDLADNVGASDTRKVVIDTTPPGAISIGSISNDTGALNNDFVTNATSVTLNGLIAAPLAVGDNKETAQISLDGGVTWTDLVVIGVNWSYADPAVKTHGAHEYQVRIIDLAGNVGPVASQIVTVDTVAPALPTITGIEDDTGTIGDFITNDTSLTIVGTLPSALEAGDLVQVSTDNGASWSNASVSGTTWSFVDGRTLSQGTYVYQVRSIDIAGNISVGSSQNVQIKTTASPANVFIDAMNDDTGTSSTDYKTSDTTPTFVGHLSEPLDSSNRVEVSFDGGTSWNTATVNVTSWTYTSAALAEGDYTVTARVIDVAGNVGSTASQAISIILTPPAVTTTITHAVDDVELYTGNILDGGLTNDNRPVLHGTLSGPAQADQFIRIYQGATVIGTVMLTVGQTDWSYALTTNLTDATHTFTARVVNIVGLEGTPSTLTLTVDTMAPTVTSLTLDDLDTDTSWLSGTTMVEDSTDFITRDTSVRVKGTSVIGADGTLQISADGGATWDNLTISAGSWVYNDPTQRLSDTTYQLRVVDEAGNVSATTVSRTVVVDVVAPTHHMLSPYMNTGAAFDTGVVGDNITTATSLRFTNTFFPNQNKDTDATLLLIHDVNGNGIYEHGIDAILGTAASATENWTFNATVEQGKSYTIGLISHDAAGNFSKLSHTDQFHIVTHDNHKSGTLTGTSASTGYYNTTAGMGVGIGTNGLYQFTVRHSTLTQTNKTTTTTVNTAHHSSDYITNNTFFDYNRDRNIDIATSSYYYGDRSQTIFTGNSDGTFTYARLDLNELTAMGGIVAFDKEGDGYLDLTWGDWGNDNTLPSFAINTGGTLAHGSVLSASITRLQPSREVSGVDIDNDGDIDLALHSARVFDTTDRTALTTLINNGSGVFDLGQTTYNIFSDATGENAYGAVSMTWADFDGDGDFDLFLGRTLDSSVSGIFLNNNGVISANKISVGDINSPMAGGISIAVDWNADGKMDVIEFSNASVSSGSINLYTNTSLSGNLSFSNNLITLASGVSHIGGATAADYDWDGDVDVVYQASGTGNVGSIENTNQVTDGTALHLRILDPEGFNVYYGNTVQLFDSTGKLVASQILNPQSGVGTNDSTGIVHFYNLSPVETYTVALLRTVSGVSQDVGGVASLTTGAQNLSTIENVNAQWTGLKTGASHNAYILSGESATAVNNGTFMGTGYNDTFFGTLGDDTFNGSGGWTKPIVDTAIWDTTGGMDIVDYKTATAGIVANLATGTATGQGNDTFINIEGIRGSDQDDTLTGNAADNLFEGRGGNDTINLSGGGRDLVVYNLLDRNDTTGGNGSDTINNFTVGNLQSNTNADVLDLRHLLRNYTGTANVYYDVGESAIVLDYASQGLREYLSVTTDSGNTLISVDVNGTGNFEVVATLTGVVTTLENLLQNHQIWVSSSHTPYVNIGINYLNTTDSTPTISGYVDKTIGINETVQVVVNGVIYSSADNGPVIIDRANNTWALVMPTALSANSYKVKVFVSDALGNVIGESHGTNMLDIASTTNLDVSSFKGVSSTQEKASALTLSEDGTWRIFSNGLAFDGNGTIHSTAGSYASQSIRLSNREAQNVTFVDLNRDGYMDIISSERNLSPGQLAWMYDGTTYTPFHVGGSGNTSAYTVTWFGGVIAYDKVGDGYVDFVYGDTAPNDASGGGGYDSTFVENNGGVFIKDRNYTSGTNGTPAPTNSGNSLPQKELSGVDINNDGTVDIVYHTNTGSNYTDITKTTTSNNAYRLVVVTNVGDGSLYSSQVLDNVFYNYTGDTAYAPSMTWADFNGDGYMDLFLGRGRTNESGSATNSDMSRILYNNEGVLVQSTTGAYATTYMGDTLRGGASIALDWNMDGRMDVIEAPEHEAGTSPVNLYTNNGDKTFTTTSLGTVLSSQNVTGALAYDIDWDGDKDLIVVKADGNNLFVQNNSTSAYGNTIHLRIVDANGINSLLGNTVQLYNSSGVLVATQIINPQSGNQTSDTSAIVDFHGLSASETYTAVLLRNIGGASQDVGGMALAGTNTIENVNAAWGNLKAGEATSAYVLTAEAGTNNADSIGPGIVGTGYNDTLFATAGNDTYNGAGGWVDGVWSHTGGMDVIDFKLAGATGVNVNLSLTGAQATGFNTVTLKNIEGVAGGAGNDTFTGNAADNQFEGRGGDDTIHLSGGGRDTVLFKLLDNLDDRGGNGTDTVHDFKIGVYEATPDADRIHLRELLVGYTGDADGAAHYIDGIPTLDSGETIAEYLRATVSGSDTIISIDRDGAGSEHAFTDLVVLKDVTTNLETLLANHQLVVT